MSNLNLCYAQPDKEYDFCRRFQTVYNGTGFSHKVNKLLENTRYKFRISSANEAGQGPVSQVYEFRTAYAHPPAVKGKVSLRNQSDRLRK